jgi:uncharacterized phage-associated protein
MAHNSDAVANYLLTASKGEGLDPMKLLKLSYLCQGWMLGLYGEPLIWNDVEAWRYGPVFPEIYRLVAGKNRVRTIPFASQDRFSEKEKHLMDQVFAKYGKYSGLALSSITHEPGSPWDVTYHTRGQNSVIPKRLIQEYYERASQSNASQRG